MTQRIRLEPIDGDGEIIEDRDVELYWQGRRVDVAADGDIVGGYGN